MGLGFSRAITASSLVFTVGVIRTMQHSWNLVGARRSVFPSEQVVTALSVRYLHGSPHVVCSVQLAWAEVTLKGSLSLRRCSSLGGCLVPSQIALYYLAVDSLRCCSGLVMVEWLHSEESGMNGCSVFSWPA